MKKKKGFTLVELLAVIVILAVILVIAVPRITDVIKNSKKASFESSAKTIISQAEKKKMEQEVLGNNNPIECNNIVNINNDDYASCEIKFDASGNAKITLIGKGKFEGLKIVDATKDNLNAVESKLPEYGIATDYISNLYSYDADSNNLKKDNTDDANIRYYGENPNNYVSFNNELWRIIGVFGNNVKLVRNESLMQREYKEFEDAEISAYGFNPWGQCKYGPDSSSLLNYDGSDIMLYLKNTYYININSEYQNMIENKIWNIGMVPNATTNTLEFYNLERGNLISSNSDMFYAENIEITWTGYIALPYVTDWAYASSSDACYTNIKSTNCYENSWMYKNGGWTITPASDVSSVWSIYGKEVFKQTTTAKNSVYPSVYLKSDVKITGGTGTSSDPYKLEI